MPCSRPSSPDFCRFALWRAATARRGKLTDVVIFREARRVDVPAIVALLADHPLGAGRETVGEDVDEAYWAVRWCN
jgi:hypothetical protein